MENHSSNDPKHWIRQEFRDLSAYHVPDATGLIKLDAMENPFSLPESLREQWSKLVSQAEINRYPDPSAKQLKERLRKAMDIPENMSLMLGNGSDEIIQILAMALAGPGKSVLSVDPGFVMYRMIATFCGMQYVGVPLKQGDFSLDLPAVLQAMDQYQPPLVFLAYPNNPTGNLFDAGQVIQIIEAAPGLVVVDEAYAPFADDSFMSRLGQYDNLLVMRTVSKMGLAGLRLGLLAGSPAWLDEFEKLRLPYNINTLTQIAAGFALDHLEVFDQQTTEIRRQRERMMRKLTEFDAFQLYPSQANFILVRLKQGSAKQLHVQLLEKGILIKILDGSAPALANCLRITIGTEQENTSLLEALELLL